MGGFDLGNLGSALSGAFQGAVAGFKNAMGGADTQGMQGVNSFGSSTPLSDGEGVNGASIMGDDAGGIAQVGNKTAADIAADMGSLFATGANEQEKDEALNSMITWAGHEVRIDYDGDGIWDVIKYVEDWSGVHRNGEQSAQEGNEVN